MDSYALASGMRDLGDKIASGLKQVPVSPAAPPVQIDTEVIADSILNGLTAIASAIEYKAQLEDARERELNIRTQPKNAGIFY